MKLALNYRLILVAVIFLVVVASISIAVTTPEGTTSLIVGNSSRRTATSAVGKNASAGNLTWLVVQGKTVTQSWQGYVGNITGTITLDDSSGYTLYDWTLANPEGEIYATYLSTVDWSTGGILCWNWSVQTGDYLQLAEFETAPSSGDATPSYYAGIGAAIDDVDGVNETFSYDGANGVGGASHSNFYVGGQYINGTRPGPACPVVKLYNGTRNNQFEEVLLYQDRK